MKRDTIKKAARNCDISAHVSGAGAAAAFVIALNQANNGDIDWALMNAALSIACTTLAAINYQSSKNLNNYLRNCNTRQK